MGFFKVLVGILQQCDREGVPVPMLFPSPTDGRTFSRLGIQTYGFIPMRFPPDFALAELAHAADERVPLDAVTFGAEAIFRLLQRFGG
jgi:acetylornithine deacetylase/succinyl-diaminopimelate desuccinylase-like protein